METIEKIDLFKEDKEYYSAKSFVTRRSFGPLNYLSIKGVSAPENELFLNSIEAIYNVAYKLKNYYKSIDRDFVVPKMEAQWWAESGKPFEETPRDEWYWNILIRLPEFVDNIVAEKAIEEVINTRGVSLASEVEMVTIDEGSCVQILHLGSYEDEAPTIAQIMKYIDDNGLKVNGHHKEIYLKDPRKTSTERLKTIIRYPVDNRD